jgi:hypothetical protein
MAYVPPEIIKTSPVSTELRPNYSREGSEILIKFLVESL